MAYINHFTTITYDMRKIIFTYLLLCLATAMMAQQDASRLARQLLDPKSKKVFVVAHRGDWRNAPENSLQAFSNCIDMGVDMIELDLKKSKDGVLIIMHDNKLDRTTTGHGLPSDYTLAELRKLRLKSGHGIATRHQIPTLEEVLLLCKGKILINIDKGYEFFKDVLALTEKTGTTAQVVIKSGHPLSKVKADNSDVLDKVIYMPIITLTAADARQRIDDYATIHPVAVECCFGKVDDNVLQLLRHVRDCGSKVWLNSLWPSLNGGHDDDTAVELNKPDETWGWLLSHGASLIQTDRPAQLIKYLKKKGRR